MDDHPDQVSAVCIRQLSPSEAVLAGSNLREQDVVGHPDILWLYAPDGAGLAVELEQTDLLDEIPSQPEVSS